MSIPAHQSVEADCGRPALEVLLDRRFVRSVILFAAFRSGSALHDEDLEQEALLRVLQAARRTGRIEYPKGFVVKIVNDTISDHWRRRRVFEDIQSIPQHLLSYCPAFERTNDDRRRLMLIYDALRRLTPQKRETIEAFYLLEHSVSDIARLLCSSTSAVKMTLLRGRQELRQMVGANARRSTI